MDWYSSEDLSQSFKQRIKATMHLVERGTSRYFEVLAQLLAIRHLVEHLVREATPIRLAIASAACAAFYCCGIAGGRLRVGVAALCPSSPVPRRSLTSVLVNARVVVPLSIRQAT